MATGLNARPGVLRLIGWGMLLLAVAALSACGGSRGSAPSSGDVQAAASGGTSYGYKVGRPYQIRGVTYTPREDFTYDRTGIASWYGPGFHGRRTASGEIYDQNALTAAHPTLQMPALVRVTNLENNRSLVLRINDRGPFAQNRIIDVSRRAAEELGFRQQGVARVRVQVLTDDSRQLALAAGRTGREPGASSAQFAAASRPAAATASRSPAPQQVASGSGLFVQAGAFSSYDSAAAVRSRLASLGPTEITTVTANGRQLYRVRVGPFRNAQEAQGMLGSVHRAGLPEARLMAGT